MTQTQSPLKTKPIDWTIGNVTDYRGLEQAAEQLRREWESRLRVATQVDMDENGKGGYPVYRLLPGAAERILKRLLFEYVAFCNTEKMERMMERVKADIQTKFNGEAAIYEAAEMTAISNRIDAVKKAMKSDDLLFHVVSAHRKKLTPTDKMRAVYQIRNQIVGQYFDEYLPECIRHGYPALKKADFIFQMALKGFIEAGNPNPILKIIFD